MKIKITAKSTKHKNVSTFEVDTVKENIQVMPKLGEYVTVTDNVHGKLIRINHLLLHNIIKFDLENNWDFVNIPEDGKFKH